MGLSIQFHVKVKFQQVTWQCVFSDPAVIYFCLYELKAAGKHEPILEKKIPTVINV